MCWLKIVRETFLKYCSMWIFRKFAVDYAYCPNSILQTEFLKYELMNLKIKLPRVYKKKVNLKAK